jgi:hypothetical protein
MTLHNALGISSKTSKSPPSTKVLRCLHKQFVQAAYVLSGQWSFGCTFQGKIIVQLGEESEEFHEAVYEYSLTSNYQDEFKYKPMIINSVYYFLLRDVVGLKSSKWDREEVEEHDV